MSNHIPNLMWEKWRPQHFDEVKPIQELAPEPTRVVEEIPTDNSLEQQRELEAFRESISRDAWQSGFEAGKAEGELQGYQQGLLRGETELKQQQQPTLNALDNLLNQVTLSLEGLDSALSCRLIQLALTLAAQLVGEEVAHNSRILVGQVRQLLAQDSLLSGPLTLKVNPEDLALLVDKLPSLETSDRWQLAADNALARGDCRLVSAEGELESALSHRWQVLCERAQRGAF